jgi:hypothetical protein
MTFIIKNLFTKKEAHMPFKSQSQRRYLYATHPKIAREWEAETPKGKKLPDKVKKRVNKTKKGVK